MAIDIDALCPESHDLAQACKGFYPVKIPVSHWQLRHYISSPEQDHLYYASGQDVFCLNTATRKRKHIATLPFESRCTASGYGWVCVGGEHDGNFAAIKLDGSGQRTLDVDSALPIDSWRQNVGQRPATVKVEHMGEEIVNSISIHRIQDEEAHLDDIVAVLSNNDKTVRVYSLPSGKVTRVKVLPFAINHATISPDGQTLVAVGDFNQAYFFGRETVDTPPQIPKPHNRLTSASVGWRLTNVVTLHCLNPQQTVGYFTTAWSPNGRLVAAGSEGGYITVIDADMLANPEKDDDDAIVAVVPGSRPDCMSPHSGAIRSMMFSPDPWDLLVWAEDQGRICIGDLRTGLKSRQVVKLEPKELGLEKLAFEDEVMEEYSTGSHLDGFETEFLRRYRSGNPSDNTAAVNVATEYIETRRRQRQQRQRQDQAYLLFQTAASGSRHASEADDPQGLNAREQQILESLRTSRQREEARANGQVPRSVNYTTPDLFHSSASRSLSSVARGTGPARPISEILSPEQESLREMSPSFAAGPPPPSSSNTTDRPHTLPPVHTLHDASLWAPPSRSGLPRVSDNSRLPRRRQSIIMSTSTDNNPNTNTSNAPTGSSSSSTRQAQLSVPDVVDIDDANPWRTIEEHMATARGSLFEGAARPHTGSPLPASERMSTENIQAEPEAQRRLNQAARAREQRERWRVTRNMASGERTVTLGEARRPAAFPDGYETLTRRTPIRGSSGVVGVRTAGLAMSPDGRVLWAACEEGIFEIQIKVKGRMFWPAIDPR